MKFIVDTLNNYIWSPALVGLCLLVGLYFSIATRFLQLRHVPGMLRYLFQNPKPPHGLSSFQAFSLAVSGRVGTGNIAGVATAIAAGGPGAVFWMWAIAFVGAGSAYVEATLAQLFKVKVDGQLRGGPAYYIEKGLGLKWYAVAFAVATVAATGLFLPGIQSNSIGSAVKAAFDIPPYVSGLAIVALLGLIIFGGVKRIGQAAERIVPIMALGYLLVALAVVGANFSQVPATFSLIFRSAFGADALFGGIIGAALSWGVKRGIYSNEAGQGTAPIAAATANVDHPAKQGLAQAFSVYVDTWLVCTATALMILVTQSYNVASPDGGFLVEYLPGVESGPAFTQNAVDSLLPGGGAAFVAIALFFFAFTTLMAYYYYAESNLAYLVKSDRARSTIITAARVAFLGIVFFGAVNQASLAWAMGDIGVGLMAWLNLVAIVLLGGPALRCLKDYEKKRREGRPTTFVSSDIAIKNADYWASEKR